MTYEEQIVACEKKLVEALTNGNTQVLDELLHDSLIFNIPTGQTITKAMDIENYRSGILNISSITGSDQIIQSIDDIVIVTVTLHLVAEYSDQRIDGKFKYLRVWKLFNNSWKVIAGSGFQIQSGN